MNVFTNAKEDRQKPRLALKRSEATQNGAPDQRGTIFYAENRAIYVTKPVTVYRLPIRLPVKSALTWPVV